MARVAYRYTLSGDAPQLVTPQSQVITRFIVIIDRTTAFFVWQQRSPDRIMLCMLYCNIQIPSSRCMLISTPLRYRQLFKAMYQLKHRHLQCRGLFDQQCIQSRCCFISASIVTGLSLMLNDCYAKARRRGDDTHHLCRFRPQVFMSWNMGRSIQYARRDFYVRYIWSVSCSSQLISYATRCKSRRTVNM